MKRSLLCALSGALFISGVVNAQISRPVEPMSTVLGAQVSLVDVPTYEVQGLDWEQIAIADEKDGKNGELYKIGRKIPVNINLLNSGVWTDVPGGKLWRLRVESEGAEGINFYFDDFFIPNGAMMHVYNQDRSDVIGAFTSNNNKEHGLFSTAITSGDVAIIEYYEPDNVLGLGRLDIGSVNHCYRGVEVLSTVEEMNQRTADPCQVDANCSEGDDWRDQQKGVVRILVSDGGFTGWCTGSLINNTAQDCTPYILSALHCAETSTAQDFNQFIFYFNYEKSGCATGTWSSTNTMSGCSKTADSGDGGGNTGSDYLLVDLGSDIPWGYNVYFNGWDANNTAAQSGVCFHHPSGCVKKISTFTSSLINSGWGISGTHWRVSWSATANGHGVTEGGSSGSPIFNENGHIVGQLTGGASFCTSPNDPDRYGKMSYNWASNPGDDLSVYLDPSNTGAMSMDGRFYPCANSIDENYLSDNTAVYPNPTNGLFTVAMKNSIEEARVEVFNSVGQMVETIDLSSMMNTGTIDLSEMASGIYYVNIYSGSVKVTKKLIKS